MSILVVKNFLDKETCEAMNAWVDDAAASGRMGTAYDPTSGSYDNPTRLTTRRYQQLFVDYPPEVHALFERIKDELGLREFPVATAGNEGINGIVVTRMTKGAGLHTHKDMAFKRGYHTLRCNVMTRKPEIGGVLHIEGKEIPLEAGDLHCYLVTRFAHGVSAIESDDSRILWMFGVYVPPSFNVEGLKRHG